MFETDLIQEWTSLESRELEADQTINRSEF